MFAKVSMTMVRCIVAAQFVAVVVSLQIIAQPSFTTHRPPEECTRYRFAPGDSLVFRLESSDTVRFIDQKVLFKHRTEFHSLVCDFTNEAGAMFLRLTLDSLHSRERYQDTDTVVERHTSPWLGRSAYIIIDSKGQRILSRLLDTTYSSLSPGGAFQPVILMNFFDSTCHTSSTNRDWLRETTDTLAECGYPYPLMRRLVTCRLTDTVCGDVASYKLSFAETGQGSFKSISNDFGIYTRCVTNGSGFHLFSGADQQLCFADVSYNYKLVVQTQHSTQRGELTTRCVTTRVYPR